MIEQACFKLTTEAGALPSRIIMFYASLEASRLTAIRSKQAGFPERFLEEYYQAIEVRDEERCFRLLNKQFGLDLAQDGSEAGICENEHDDQLGPKLESELHFEAIAGRVLEAMLVRKFNEVNTEPKYLGHHGWGTVTTLNNPHCLDAYLWAAGIKQDRSDFERASPVPVVRAVGTGLKSTKEGFPDIHSPNNPHHDIVFVIWNRASSRWEPALKKESNGISGHHAGIQVKAIKSGERENIVVPLHEKKYSQVVTLLEGSKGRAWDAAEAFCSNLETNRCSTIAIMRNVRTGEDFGLHQTFTNLYYEYIRLWHLRERLPDKASSKSLRRVRQHLYREARSILNG